MNQTKDNASSPEQQARPDPVQGQASAAAAPAYDREKKLKELLAQDEKKSPWADEFFGF